MHSSAVGSADGALRDRCPAPQLLDMRMTGIGPDDEMAIVENLRARQERAEKAAVLGR